MNVVEFYDQLNDLVIRMLDDDQRLWAIELTVEMTRSRRAERQTEHGTVADNGNDKSRFQIDHVRNYYRAD